MFLLSCNNIQYIGVYIICVCSVIFYCKTWFKMKKKYAKFGIKTCLKTIRIRLAWQDRIKMTETELLGLQYFAMYFGLYFWLTKILKTRKLN